MAVLMPQGKQQYLADDGTPLSGGKLYTYAAGTSTPLATYSEYTGTTANANPVILDSRGEASIYWANAAYKVVLKTSADVLVWSEPVLEPALPASELASTAAGKGAALIGYSTLGITVKDALDLKAPLASPALTGNPTAPTQTAGDNSTKIATTAYADGSSSTAATAAQTAAEATAAAALSSHVSDADPHTGYMRRVATSSVSASGVAVDFSSIPSWVKRITISYSAIATSGTSIPVFRIGSSGTPTTSGYAGCTSGVSTGASAVNHTDGSRMFSTSWASTYIGHGGIVLTLMDTTANRWEYRQITGLANPAASAFSGGSTALAGTLDIVRLTTQGGTDTFTAGTLRMIYEG